MERPVVYACKNQNRELRLRSSSGGVFYALAQEVINHGGVVFGARFNENWEVVHSCCDEVSELQAFLGSKYVQSCLGNVFIQVKEILDGNRVVLFTGTPCQISGLKGYLNRDYKNLVLVDFVCHGVPSPKVWKDYLLENFDITKIKNISFREKTDGWKKFSLRVDSDKKSYRNNLQKDWYLKGFLKNIYLRPSCYECAFKGYERQANITLADFWGVEKVLPEFYDEDGVSLLLINDKRGQEIWKTVEDQFICQEGPVKKALEKNSAMLKSPIHPVGRNKFFSTDGTVQQRVRTITGDYFIAKVIKKLKKILHLERKVV